ncbi:MAG: sigma 54-interacting transcriptional regulator [Polyangiaceae bacterium]
MTGRAVSCHARSVLHLVEPGQALAERFLEGDLDRREIEAHPVLARWARAANLGVRADSLALPEGPAGADLAVRRDRLEAVFREESKILSPLAEELSARSMLAILTDPEGVVLLSRGGGDFNAHAAKVRLAEGTCWSEAARGTNAIGTAIVERRPVAVIGGAHFEERNRGLFCYATPILDPYGDLAAVLDVTGAAEQHSAAIGVAVQAAGSALSRALALREFAAVNPGGYAVIERLLHRTSTPALLVQANGAVLAMNPAARAALGLGASDPRRAPGDSEPPLPRGLQAEHVFGVGADALRALGMSGNTPSPLRAAARLHAEQARFQTPQGRYKLDVEPIAGTEGRLLSMIVYLEPDTEVRAPSPRPSAPAQRTASPLPPAFDAILGTDPELVAAKKMAARFSKAPLPVLLLAETGTGKELFARATHAASPRGGGPFVALNCGGLAPSLLESELFGHAPGAFTGAQRSGAMGKLAAADGGTLFLDEIAEMPPSLQATLLRVLEDGSYYRVGESRARRADFRLVCATCRDMPRMVAAGAFRRDLFFRIQGVTITIPPLRARADRLVLARGLLSKLAAEQDVPCPELSDDAVAWILEHDWPGNVRELKSALAHAIVMSEGSGVVDAACFPRPVLLDPRLDAMMNRPVPSPSMAPSAAPRSRDEILDAAMDEALRESAGNVSEAARRLGVARSTLYRRIPRKPRGA